jgi:hypothetical protein
MATVRGDNDETPAFGRKANPAARVRAHEREHLAADAYCEVPSLEHFPSEIRKGDESMRAGKLTTLSAVAVLVGGTILATNLAIGQAPQSGNSVQAGPGAQGRIAGVHEMKHKIPQLSSIGTTLRIDAVVPRSVRQAAVPLPPHVQRMEPRFRNDRVFRYRDQVVILDPATSRIVAIVKAPT